MLNFVTKDNSGFYSHKGIPENVKEFEEDLNDFLEIEEGLKNKKLSSKRLSNLIAIFKGLAQVLDLLKDRHDAEAAELRAVVKKSEEELISLREEKEKLVDLNRGFYVLRDKVVADSDRFIIKAFKKISNAKNKSVLDLEKFLKDSNVKKEDMDEEDAKSLSSQGVNFL